MPRQKQSARAPTRTSASRSERMRQATAPIEAPRKFYAKGNKVLCRNRELLFEGDLQSDAPETVMLEAFPIEGDENALTAPEVARVVADALNKALVA